MIIVVKQHETGMFICKRIRVSLMLFFYLVWMITYEMMNTKSGWLGIVSNLMLSLVYHSSVGCAPIMTLAPTTQPSSPLTALSIATHCLPPGSPLLAHHLTPLPVMLLFFFEKCSHASTATAHCQWWEYPLPCCTPPLTARSRHLGSPVVLSSWCWLPFKLMASNRAAM